MADQLLRHDAGQRRRVDDGKQRIAFLWHASRAIASEPLDVTAICRNLAEYLSRDIADCCLIDLIGDDQMVHRIAMAHDGRVLREEAPVPYRLDLRVGVGLHRVAHTGRAEMNQDSSSETLAILLGGSNGHAWQQALDFRDYAVVPLASGDRILGAITLLSCRSDRQVGPVELAMVQEVASRATLAIENARLHQETQNARAEADRLAERFAFLTRVGDILAGSLDYHTTLSSVARLMVPMLADCCVVHLVEENGAITCVEAAHRNPAKEAMLRATAAPWLLEPSSVPHVIQTGKSQLVADLSFVVLKERAGQYPELGETMASLPPTSMLAVPLIARGRTLGAISLFVPREVHVYEEEDLLLAEEVARRAALAVDNARLFRQAQQAALIQQNLLTLASQDLKNPLNVVLLGASFLNATLPGGPEAEEWVKTAGNIHHAGEKMARLIHQLIDLVALEKGELEIDRQKLDIRPLFDDVLQHWKPGAAEKMLRWDVRLDLDGIQVAGDAVRVGQVLHLLVGQAVKATPAGGTVTISADRLSDRVEIRVTDQGPGLVPEKMATLFDPYAACAKKSGRDFSFPIAMGILRAHGGDLGVVSHPGDGSSFFMTLPLANA